MAVTSRRVAERRALLTTGAAVAGVVIALVSGASWSVTALVAWDAAAVVFLLLVWWAIGRRSAGETAALAQGEEGSRRASEALLVAAGTASLIAVGFTLARAGRVHDDARAALIALAVVSVALAWTCLHTVYTLRYARLYFTPPIGGLTFSAGDPPQYADFAYVAFTIGMTYQVSDTAIAKTTMRRTVVHHALLSYLFGAVLLAVAVSTISTLLGG